METRKESNNWGFLSSFYQSAATFFSSENDSTENNHLEKINIEKPEQILNNVNDIVKGKALLYDIYFIKISPNKEDSHLENRESDNVIKMHLDDVRQLLDLLNRDENSRSALHALNYFTSGNFIMARADAHAQDHHNIFVKCLKKHDFYIKAIIESLSETIKNNKYTNLKELIAMPLRDMLVKGFFELDSIPPELNNAISAFASIAEEATEKFSTNVKLHTLSSELLPNWSLGALKDFRKVKKHYERSTKEFLLNQKEAIYSAIQTFALEKKCQNLMALSIIQLIKEDYDIKTKDEKKLRSLLTSLTKKEIENYLDRKEIIAIPASITASINLVIIFMCSLLALHYQIDLKENLLKELKDNNIDTLIKENNYQGLREAFDKNTNQNGLLHRIYLESLRRENIFKTSEHLALETLQTRYTSNDINLFGRIIPANSIIMILPGTIRFDHTLWNNPESFDPNRFVNKTLSHYSLSVFSQGSRQCPAQFVSAYIFKSMLSYLTLFCDLKLEIEKERNIDNISVECKQKNIEKTLQSPMLL